MHEDSENHKRVQIIMSLKRSRVRREILRYLSRIYPQSSYPARIAGEIRTTPSNVLCAIRGADGRYVALLSLISLGLIEIENSDGRKCYKLSREGIEAARQIRNT